MRKNGDTVTADLENLEKSANLTLVTGKSVKLGNIMQGKVRKLWFACGMFYRSSDIVT